MHESHSLPIAALDASPAQILWPDQSHARNRATTAMNLEQLRKNQGWRMQLQPPAIYLDDRGRALPHRDDDWIFDVNADGSELDLWKFQKGVDELKSLNLERVKWAGLVTTIGKDVVHRFDTDRSRGTEFGFLVLNQQMYVQGRRIFFRPCSRPGDRVEPPPAIKIEELAITSDYLLKSGILENLEESGFEVNGIRESRLPELELEGWELIVDVDNKGRLRSFFFPGRDRLVYVKRRRAQPATPPSPNYTLQIQGDCPNCGTVTYLYGRDELREDIAKRRPLNLLCLNCNKSRDANHVECERLAKIARAER